MQHAIPHIAVFLAMFMGIFGFASSAYITTGPIEMEGVAATVETAEPEYATSSHVGGDVVSFDNVGYRLTVPEKWEAVSLPADLTEDVGEMYYGIPGVYDGGMVFMYNDTDDSIAVGALLPVEPGDKETLEALYDRYANEVMAPEESETVQMGDLSVLLCHAEDGSLMGIAMAEQLLIVLDTYNETGDDLMATLEQIIASVELFEAER